jgi:hypothetical protein
MNTIFPRINDTYELKQLIRSQQSPGLRWHHTVVRVNLFHLNAVHWLFVSSEIHYKSRTTSSSVHFQFT